MRCNTLVISKWRKDLTIIYTIKFGEILIYPLMFCNSNLLTYCYIAFGYKPFYSCHWWDGCKVSSQLKIIKTMSFYSHRNFFNLIFFPFTLFVSNYWSSTCLFHLQMSLNNVKFVKLKTINLLNFYYTPTLFPKALKKKKTNKR